MIIKEVRDTIVSILEKAEDFYVPVKKLWKKLKSQGFNLPDYDDFLASLEKDAKLEMIDPKIEPYENEEEMEALGFYSGPRVKLRERRITKEDMMRILMRHSQNMIDNLVRAYEVKPADLPGNTEDELINSMVKAKKLQEGIKEM